MHRAINTITRLTRQQMLENVVTYYFIEGHGPAFSPGNGCRYFLDEGATQTKCGIGCQFTDGDAKLIDDAFADGVSVGELLKRDLAEVEDHVRHVCELVRNTIEPTDGTFAMALQSAHDGPAGLNHPKPETVADFRRELWIKLAELADKYNLELRPVTR